MATGNVLLAQLLGQVTARPAAVASSIMAVVLPGFVFGIVVLGALQLAYVERLSLRTGQRPDET